MKYFLFIFLCLNTLAQEFNHKIDSFILAMNESLKHETYKGDQIPFTLSENLLYNYGITSLSDTIHVIITYSGDISDLQSISYLNLHSVWGNTVTAEVPLDKVTELASFQSITSINVGRPVELCLDIADAKVRASLGRNTFNLKGRNVLLGLIDSGIDVDCADFKNTSDQTRILYIWDQTDGTGPYPYPALNYGTEYTSAQINSCNEKDMANHGTLVAGVAGGNGLATGNNQPAGTYVGIAPEADLIIIKTDLSDYAHIIDALTYMHLKAIELQKPWVANLSLGSTWGPRDGTSPFEHAVEQIYSQSTTKGKMIVVSAGNAGYDLNDPNRQDDDRKHSSAYGSNSTKAFLINSSQDPDEEMWMEIWYPQNLLYGITVHAPDGSLYGPYFPGFGTGSYNQALVTDDGLIYIHNEHFLNDHYPWTSDNLIEICIYENLQYPDSPIRNGEWRIQMTAGQGGRWDSYIVYDDISGDSYFNYSDFDNTRNLTEPSTGNHVLCVSSYNSKNSWISPSGSQTKQGYPIDQISYFASSGPTRDGRSKPDIFAPGAWVASSCSFDNTSNPPAPTYLELDGEHFNAYGTSISAPFIAGTCALLLEQNPDYTFDQIKNILDATKTYQGYLDVYAALDYYGQNPSNDVYKDPKIPFLNKNLSFFELRPFRKY